MTNKLKILFLGVSFAFSSCVVHSHHPHRRAYRQTTVHQGLPPGQAKKVYGTKSAKPFAPGQRKKARNRAYHIN